jgi:serine/threonine protein kinase/HEAT repeat protein
MERRYEIKGKIGQGGLGVVYRAHDLRMNREVAIKRIIANTDDVTLPEEATRQLILEASALASLQHPNIVTVYDVGSDDDGAFVVMELLTGDTIEDAIVKASFTWADFRQLAKQTMEALIAAQELNIVHRDLKPGNIMLTWLPSGKFQVKIVDFGLSKLSSMPSLQTIDQADGVFGSIYFMAPEQFERVPIDLKVDLYAIGCVFYYALTGIYPFDGDTAAEVMAAHLQHHVTPLQEIREGIPLWACDWIMWHINRNPADRPATARDSLRVFIENDEQTSSPLSTGQPALAVEQPKRPRLVIPGSVPVPKLVKEVPPIQTLKTASIPKALAPPVGSKASVHTTAQVLESSKSVVAAPLTEATPEPEVVPTTPAKPVPEVAKPASTILQRPVIPVAPPASISISKPKLTLIAKPAASPVPTSKIPPISNVVPAVAPPRKKGLSNGLKMSIAAILGVLTVGLAVLLLKKSGDNAEAKLYNEMIEQATKPGAAEVPVDNRKLEILLRTATDVGANTQRDAIYTALYLAKSTDGTDVDARIAEVSTTQEIVPNIRIILIRDVLRKRNNPAIIGTLMKFALSTKDVQAAEAAIQATRFMGDDSHFAEMLDVIKTSKEPRIITAAEENAVKIIEKSKSKAALGTTIATAYDSAPNDLVRHTMLRLFGRIGGAEALELVQKNLDSTEMKDKIAAIVALGVWGDQGGYTTLIEFLKTATDLQIRTRAFNSAFEYAAQNESDIQENWTLLAAESKTQDEQKKLIRGMVNIKPAPWVYAIIQKFADSSEYDEVKDLAERATDKLKDIESIQAGGGKDEE